jgi:hypothetical protein
MTMEPTPDLTEVEMVEILKAIAREGGNAAARIAAIKELRAMLRGEPPAEDSVAKLYEVANPGRIRVKSQAA